MPVGRRSILYRMGEITKVLASPDSRWWFVFGENHQHLFNIPVHPKMTRIHVLDIAHIMSSDTVDVEPMPMTVDRNRAHILRPADLRPAKSDRKKKRVAILKPIVDDIYGFEP